MRELLLFCKSVFYRSAPCFCLRLRQSAIMARNSEFVRFPFMFDTVCPKNFCKTSMSPLSHATSMAWRIARSTLEFVVLFFFAFFFYSTLVTAFIMSMSFMVRIIASRRY